MLHPIYTLFLGVILKIRETSESRLTKSLPKLPFKVQRLFSASVTSFMDLLKNVRSFWKLGFDYLTTTTTTSNFTKFFLSFQSFWRKLNRFLMIRLKNGRGKINNTSWAKFTNHFYIVCLIKLGRFYKEIKYLQL